MGRPPSKDEFCLNVFLFEKKNEIKRFYFGDAMGVAECKKQMTKEFEVGNDYMLWDLDYARDPCQLIKEKDSWGRNSVKNGETLVLKKTQKEEMTSFISLHIF